MDWKSTLRGLAAPLIFICIGKGNALAQFSLPDTTVSPLQNAIALYHDYLSPETTLYNGGEYSYNAYYPFIINEGHPFFESRSSDSGSIFYMGMLYKNVPLMFDIIKQEVLIRDPSNLNIIRLYQEKVNWFTIYGHTFIKIVPDSSSLNQIKPGFYDLLYPGKTLVLRKVVKEIRETNSLQGYNKYVVEESKYYIKNGNEYSEIKKRKALLNALKDKKKEISLYMRGNKMKLKKNLSIELPAIVDYYDKLTPANTKADN